MSENTKLQLRNSLIFGIVFIIAGTILFAFIIYMRRRVRMTIEIIKVTFYF